MILILVVLVMKMSVRVVGEDVWGCLGMQTSRCAGLYMLLHVLVLGRKGCSIGALRSLELMLVYVDLAR